MFYLEFLTSTQNHFRMIDYLVERLLLIAIIIKKDNYNI